MNINYFYLVFIFVQCLHSLSYATLSEDYSKHHQAGALARRSSGVPLSPPSPFRPVPLDKIEEIYIPTHANTPHTFVMRFDPTPNGNRSLFEEVHSWSKKLRETSFIGIDFSEQIQPSGLEHRFGATDSILPFSSQAEFSWTRDFSKVIYYRTRGQTSPKMRPALFNFITQADSPRQHLCRFVGQHLSIPTVEIPAMSHSGNRGGNLDVTPNGVLYFGNNMDPHVANFFIQRGNFQNHWTQLNTRWLAVGHVDEMLTFINIPNPRKERPAHCSFALVKASPSLAIRLLYEHLQEHSEKELSLNKFLRKKMHPFYSKGRHLDTLHLLGLAHKTPDYISKMQSSIPRSSTLPFQREIIDNWTNFLEEQTKFESLIDQNISLVLRKIKEKNPECSFIPVVEIPQLFETQAPKSYEKIKLKEPNMTPEEYARYVRGFSSKANSLGSNSVNMTVWDRHILIPKPFFAPFEHYIRGVLSAAPFYQDINFLDSTYYSQRGGELHCATLEVRFSRQLSPCLR